jgi:hypothetical protein
MYVANRTSVSRRRDRIEEDDGRLVALPYFPACVADLQAQIDESAVSGKVLD